MTSAIARLAVTIALAIVAMLTTAPASRAADPVPCAEIFNIFPTDGALYTEIILEHCVVHHNLMINGRKFTFVDILGYEPADNTQRMNLAREAVEAAAPIYNSWFRVPDAVIVSGKFRSFSGLLPEGSSGTLLGYTWGDSTGCIVFIDDAARHAGYGADMTHLDQFQRLVAHELFHCVEFSDPTLHNEYVRWRDEGAAEYFAGVAIPASMPDVFYYGDMPMLAATPLFRLGYSAYPFIAYLGRQRGTPAVVDLLRGAVRDGSDEASLETLHTIPDVQQLFHDFAKAWLDGLLTDEDGAPLPAGIPDFPEPLEVDREQVLQIPAVEPFVAAVGLYRFARGTSWELEAPQPDAALASWRVADESAWSRLGTTVDGCEDGKTGAILLTATAGPVVAANYTIAVTQNETPMRNCACPVGSWHIGTDELRATALGRLMPGALISGGVTLTFDGAGHATANYDEITFDSPIDNDGGAIRSILTGTVSWTWVRKPWSAAGTGTAAPEGAGIDALALQRTTAGVSAHWRVEFWSRGRRIRSQEKPFREAGNSGSVSIATAICNGTTLVLAPGNASPGNVGPPWHGTFQRQ